MKERRILQETWSTTATQKLLQGELFQGVKSWAFINFFLDKLKFKDKTTKLYFNSIQIWGKIISIVDLHEVKFCFVRNKFASN